MKLFSDVSYELLHIKHVLPAYHLKAVENDFEAATCESLNLTGGIILKTALEIKREAKDLGLEIPAERRIPHFEQFVWDPIQVVLQPLIEFCFGESRQASVDSLFLITFNRVPGISPVQGAFVFRVDVGHWRPNPGVDPP